MYHRIVVSSCRSRRPGHYGLLCRIAKKKVCCYSSNSTSRINAAAAAFSFAQEVASNRFQESKGLFASRTFSSKDKQAHFQEALMELAEEREALFGGFEKEAASSQVGTINHGSDRVGGQPPSLQSRQFSKSSKDNHAHFEEEIMELAEEREALFGFTEDEKVAWSQVGTKDTSADASSYKSVASFIQQHEEMQSLQLPNEKESNDTNNILTHLSRDETSVSMVNVGHKVVTRRMARAQTKLSLPPKVLEACKLTNKQAVGPKGPIFATAQLAGIMAAKRTSDLIPLCHPLPLEKVNIDIEYDEASQKVVVECTCHVTHKTGVEMEALTGASVAALTIYDMVKAISHEVVIEETKLVAKTGGKRTVGVAQEEETEL